MRVRLRCRSIVFYLYYRRIYRYWLDHLLVAAVFIFGMLGAGLLGSRPLSALVVVIAGVGELLVICMRLDFEEFEDGGYSDLRFIAGLSGDDIYFVCSRLIDLLMSGDISLTPEVATRLYDVRSDYCALSAANTAQDLI